MFVLNPSPSYGQGPRWRAWLLLLGTLLVASPAFSQANNTTAAAQLTALYRIVGDSFWRAEKRWALERQDTSAPVVESSAAGLEYSRSAAAADAFLTLADESGTSNWMRDPVLYLGGLAHYTLGNYQRAAELFAQLNPGYQRAYYINDRHRPNPEFSVPTRPGISKLLFHSRLQILPATSANGPGDAFAALQQITREALTTLGAQQQYAHYLANRPIIHDRRDWSEAAFGGQPDQIRAGALPSTLQLVEAAWDKLLEPSLKGGAKPIREWLRSLSAPDVPLAKLAQYKLQTIDALIIKAYFAEAQQLLNAKNFDGARAKYRQIMAEYSGSAAAMRAEAALPGIVPVAVAYYTAEAERNFQPTNRLGVPQTKAREYYEKLLREEPNSDIGSYGLARALATENKIDASLARLADFDKKHPQSARRAEAIYLQGFLLGAKKKPDYAKAVALMDKVAAEHGAAPEAPEALFHAAMYLAWQNQFGPAIERLKKLQSYTGSKRHQWAAPWIERLGKKQQDGSKWP